MISLLPFLLDPEVPGSFAQATLPHDRDYPAALRLFHLFPEVSEPLCFAGFDYER